MGRQEEEIIKKWNYRMWFFFLSTQSEHISTSITKPMGGQHSTGNFNEKLKKKMFCERIEIFHLEN